MNSIPTKKPQKARRIPMLMQMLLALLPFQAWTQELGRIDDTVYSVALHEMRPLQVILPSSYKADGLTRYDVLYVLDGEWNTSLAATLRGFLEYGGFIPANLIVVGIPNLYKGSDNLRDRDFTPTVSNYNPLSGGAANFLSFLKHELIPHINEKYLTNKENNTLYGTSLGGLFTLYAFLQEPLLFRSYLMIEPSLFWENGYMQKLASEKMRTFPDVLGTLWMASRDGKAYQDMGVSSMESILKSQAPKSLDWQVQTYPNETHFSVIWKGLYDGYRFTYRGMIAEGRFAFVPMNGRLVKAKPFTMRCSNTGSANYIHYTTDGSEPTKISPTLQTENVFNFSKSTVVTIKSLSARKEIEKSVRCHFVVTERPEPSMQKPKGTGSGGLRYRFYVGNRDSSSDAARTKPFAKGIAGKGFDIHQVVKQEGFFCLLDGFVEVPSEGYYIVAINANRNASVWIGEQQVIGDQPAETEGQIFIIYLQKGFYSYKIAYLQRKEEQRLPPVMWFQDDGHEFSEAPVSFFYK